MSKAPARVAELEAEVRDLRIEASRLKSDLTRLRLHAVPLLDHTLCPHDLWHVAGTCLTTRAYGASVHSVTEECRRCGLTRHRDVTPAWMRDYDAGAGRA